MQTLFFPPFAAAFARVDRKYELQGHRRKVQLRRRQFPDRRQEIPGFHPEGYLRAPIVRERDLRLESLRV